MEGKAHPHLIFAFQFFKEVMMNRRVFIAATPALCTVAVPAIFSPSVRAAEEGKAGLAKAAAASLVKVGSTLENLQAAYNGQSNARAKYVAYAKKADEEGYGQVASLFRAAAKSGEIHIENCAKAIKAMGGDAKADIKVVEPKSTLENLQDGIKGEAYEAELMYPAFLKKAREENHTDAVRSFNFALNAEKTHVNLYKEARGKLDEMKSPGGAVFFVCPTCGYTVKKADLTFAKCPICSTSAKIFVEVK